MDSYAPLVVRYIYRGETLRNGRVLELPQGGESAHVSGATILDALKSAEANAPVHRLMPFFYSKRLEGWQPLTPQVDVPVGDIPARVEIMLEQPVLSHEAMASLLTAERLPGSLSASAVTAVGDPRTQASFGAREGFYGIGIYNSKSADNVGTLWRTAFMLGASYIFTIGSRNAWEKSADTYKAWRHVPAFRYADWGAFSAAAPYSTVWVAVEMGGSK